MVALQTRRRADLAIRLLQDGLWRSLSDRLESCLPQTPSFKETLKVHDQKTPQQPDTRNLAGIRYSAIFCKPSLPDPAPSSSLSIQA